MDDVAHVSSDHISVPVDGKTCTGKRVPERRFPGSGSCTDHNRVVCGFPKVWQVRCDVDYVKSKHWLICPFRSLPSMTAAFAHDFGVSYSLLRQQTAAFRRVLHPKKRNAKSLQTVQTPILGGEARTKIVMGSQSIEAVTADGSIPEILQAKGRTIRVNYIRRDGIYEVEYPPGCQGWSWCRSGHA